MKFIGKLMLTSIFTLALAFGMTACGDSKTTETKPATDNKSTATTQTSSSDSVGVPECDEYIKKYEICVNSKVPEASRAALKSAFDQTRKSWKEAAANPQGKSALATGCKQALETAKQSMAAYSCEW